MPVGVRVDACESTRVRERVCEEERCSVFRPSQSLLQRPKTKSFLQPSVAVNLTDLKVFSFN